MPLDADKTSPRKRPNLARRLRARLPFDRHTVREAFSKENLFSVFKTVAWVLPLTLLIWVYAEREQILKDALPSSFTIDVRNPDPNRIVTLLEPRDKTISVELSGPKRKVYELRDLLISGQPLNGGISSGGVLVDLDPNLPLGETQLPTLGQLNSSPLFRDRGVTISNVSPPQFKVIIDELVDTTFVISAPTQSAGNLEGAPTFTPETLTLKVAKRELLAHKNFDAQNRPQIFADLGTVLQRPPGLHENIEVAVIRPTEHSVGALPKIRATFRVRQLDVTGEISAIPVFLVCPSGVLDDFKVIYTPTFPNVQVTGPAATIELLERRQLIPKALLEINREDTIDAVKGQQRTRKLRFYDLPDGVTVSPDTRNRELNFTVVDRPASE